ncbi:IS1 family transposase [Mycobacterium riyadhense]|uniref:IS1 family transposase n=1 Tax=Mycobacterium riyadhense TaxID=486698 RepID=UPI001957690D|nr:IS1 family transposase [Mycobacterium riyadhense]
MDPVPQGECLDLDAEVGEIAVWGVVPPAIEFGTPEIEPGRVHVHRRLDRQAQKDIDSSYSIVTVRNGENRLVIEGTAAVAYSISELTGREMTPLVCPHCGETHIDELKFATHPHAKHLCNSCGRNFFDREPSISNPLAEANKQLGLPQPPDVENADRPLEITSSDYRGIALWPSNAAIVSTMSRPEEVGVHVHAWDLNGRMTIDETFSPVVIDGHPIGEAQLRLLAAQRALADGAPVISKSCDGCGRSLASPESDWLEPVTKHRCGQCGAQTSTRRRSFLNPLADVLDGE